MEIILKQNVEKLGFINEIVTVKNGYGRNYLIPKGFGVLATDSAKKVLTEELKQKTKKEEKETKAANKIAQKLSEIKVTIKANVAEDGEKLFGSIKNSDFAKAVKELGVEIDSKFVKLPKIKSLGSFTAEVRLNRSVRLDMNFDVIAK